MAQFLRIENETVHQILKTGFETANRTIIICPTFQKNTPTITIVNIFQITFNYLKNLLVRIQTSKQFNSYGENLTI